MGFEWNVDKAARNLAVHGVSFEEAAAVFADSLSWTFPDPDHSRGERRYLSIGMSAQGRILIVVHTERDDDIRIISAREATRPERRYYYEKGSQG
jgi:uncharacterized DUF497 family protein